MRIESVLKKMPEIRANQLIRVGIDGMSERLREKAGKPIKDDMIIEYFTRLIERGHVQFKTFFIFGYESETIEDFQCFERLMNRLFMIPMHKNVSLRIKWTPFVPQPCTPFKDEKSIYNFNMVQKINVWHALFKRPRNEPGWFVENDGLMSKKSHKLQKDLTAGDEDILQKITRSEPLHNV